MKAALPALQLRPPQHFRPLSHRWPGPAQRSLPPLSSSSSRRQRALSSPFSLTHVSFLQHSWPQRPQLSLSVSRSRHLPLQFLKPGLHSHWLPRQRAFSQQSSSRLQRRSSPTSVQAAAAAGSALATIPAGQTRGRGDRSRAVPPPRLRRAPGVSRWAPLPRRRPARRPLPGQQPGSLPWSWSRSWPAGWPAPGRGPARHRS